jgi:D-alanyl-D-alanine carboxypeptidase
LPELPEEWQAVRLRQLLNHTSGIPDFSNEADFADAVVAHPRKPPPPEELLSFIKNKSLDFEPGTRYRYSNSDNIVVGLMIEAATKSSDESQLQKRVFGPLVLTETSLPVGAQLEEPFIHGYVNDPSEQPPEDVSEIIAAGWAWASGHSVHA